MKDHLDRLAAHALDRLPAAMPRIGSRFDPVAEAEVPLAEPGPVAEEPSVFHQPASAPVAPEAAPVGSPDMPTSNPPSTGDVDAITPPDGLPVDPTAPHRRRAERGVPRPVPVSPPFNGVRPAADLPLPEPLPATAAWPEGDFPARPARPVGPLAAPRSFDRTSDVELAVIPELLPPSTAATATPVASGGPRTTQSASGGPRTTQFKQAEAEDPATPLLPPEAPEPRSITGNVPQPVPGTPAPMIQVSIGRIEVRALPPAPPAPAARTPRVMGLDDYLRRRKGEAP